MSLPQNIYRIFNQMRPETYTFQGRFAWQRASVAASKIEQN